MLLPNIVFLNDPNHLVDVAREAVTLDTKAPPDLFLIIGTSLNPQLPGPQNLVKKDTESVYEGGHKVICINKSCISGLEEWNDYWLEEDLEKFANEYRGPASSNCNDSPAQKNNPARQKTPRVGKISLEASQLNDETRRRILVI
ncbi:uncharacterized protein F5Z01DRAFT_634672 [Emericellopsis atlantica]|uniref:Deacetylase sirtuin-type domain-containing protein n=1 Tax=Emericellopsis atlantica TaxID=2614577 RepID=A0A9P7ZRJ8_9HYPO|nr:uncharacterized protein F5Z01DRAFT_634672 [Emericellopsis atlantica]KAG9256353.1 hypothetical protein F5Z01DRAFT_634672 [Emericellopsis atlantica]